MMNFLSLSNSSAVTLSIAIILFAAFLMTRVTKKLGMPNVTGYIVAGIIIGPCALGLVPREVTANMEFVTDVALAFIAFGVGKYLKSEVLRQNSKRIFIITLFESLVAAICVSLAMIYIFHLPVAFSLVIGAIGSATAPASTIMTIRQYNAKGVFVDTLLQVVALDDVVSLVAFSVATAVVQALSSGGGISFSDISRPIIYNALSIALGAVFGFILSRLITEKRTRDNRLILTVAIILLATGICSAFDVSPLLACMAIGTVFGNINDDTTVFHQVSNFTPPILAIFFVLSGMRLDLHALVDAGIIGVSYFFIRIIGKYVGAYLGCRVSGAPKEVRNYLGVALCPQAGVSIGLAILAQRILPSASGDLVSVIILSSSILYEIIGPVCAKFALFRSGSIT